MERLINGLLAYSRVGTKGGDFVVVNLNALLGDALRNLQGSLNIAQAQVTHDDLPALPADATQITQLFQNLIGNAVKFRSEQPPQIHVGVRREPDRWVFSVQDKGIGIDPQYFERIFQLFQRLHTRKAYPGTGIGLAICKRIVERHRARSGRVPAWPGHHVLLLNTRSRDQLGRAVPNAPQGATVPNVVFRDAIEQDRVVNVVPPHCGEWALVRFQIISLLNLSCPNTASSNSLR